MEDYRSDDFFATEENYTDFMASNVAPWLSECVSHGSFKGKDDIDIGYYYACDKDNKASIVISHGFCEFFGKYHELSYYFSKAGYNVFFIEHRGFGHSGRMCENPKMAYVDSFEDYVQDLHVFVRDVVSRIVKESGAASEGLPVYLYSHSMGGCIAALTGEKYPKDFAGIVMSSPMFSLTWGGTPEPAMWAILTAETVTGRLDTYMPGQSDYVVGNRNFEKSSGRSRKRYEYFMAIKDSDEQCQIAGGSFAWGRAALKAMERAIRVASLIEAPAILFSAGKDNMVTPEGQISFLKHNPSIRHIDYPEAKHELYNEVDEIRIPYIREVLGFFGSL